MAEPAEYEVTNAEVLELIGITQAVAITLIKVTPQPEALNVRMVKEGNNCVNSGEDDEDGDEDAEDQVLPLLTLGYAV